MLALYTESGFFFVEMYAFIIGGQRCWEVKLIQVVAVALFYSVSINSPQSLIQFSFKYTPIK